MADPETLRLYDARAQDYARLAGSETPDATLAAFIAALPAGGRVLDLGCGPGFAAGHMAAAGLSVEAWDASAGMVALAVTRPGVAARQAGFGDLASEACYDGIWANFSLLHVSKAEMPDHLARIARALKPGGMFHIGLKEGTGEARDSLGRFYAYYTEPELAGLLVAAGLVPGSFRRGIDRGLDGMDAPWISVTAHA